MGILPEKPNFGFFEIFQLKFFGKGNKFFSNNIFIRGIPAYKGSKFCSEFERAETQKIFRKLLKSSKEVFNFDDLS